MYQLGIGARFIRDAGEGQLKSGNRSTYRIHPSHILNTFIRENRLPARLPPVTPRSRSIRNPMQRVFEAFGSNSNRHVLIPTKVQLNEAKGNLFALKPPYRMRQIKKLAESSRNDDTAIRELMQNLRLVRKMFHQIFEVLNKTEGVDGLSELWNE